MPVVGTQQSPIRIANADAIEVPASYPGFAFSYSGSLTGRYKGDNFVFDVSATPETAACTAGKTITFGTQTWIIRKIHNHNPAKHTSEENDPLPYEFHLLHSLLGDVKARGPKLVIATFFDVATAKHKPTGKKLAAMKSVDRSSNVDLKEKLKTYVPSGDDPHVCEAEQATPINPAHFRPADSQRNRWCHYEGSLTTDPFTEDVTWFVMPDESFIEASEISEIGKCAQQHARPVHALDRRFVLRGHPGTSSKFTLIFVSSAVPGGVG